MKPIFIRMTMLMSVGLALVPALGLAAGKTAKGILPQATAVAKKWNADAVLTAASALDAKPDGTAPAWSLSFYSAKAKKSYIVNNRDGRSAGLEVLAYGTDPVGEFIDSDKAMTSAKKNGMKAKKQVPMAVRVLGSGKEAHSYWTVGTALGPGEVAVVIDAKTGALFTKHEGQLFLSRSFRPAEPR